MVSYIRAKKKYFEKANENGASLVRVRVRGARIHGRTHDARRGQAVQCGWNGKMAMTAEKWQDNALLYCHLRLKSIAVMKNPMPMTKHPVFAKPCAATTCECFLFPYPVPLPFI